MNLSLVVLVVLLLAILLAGGRYIHRRYFVPRQPGSGAREGSIEAGGAAVASLVIAALVILFLIYAGFALFHWFTPATTSVKVGAAVAH